MRRSGRVRILTITGAFQALFHLCVYIFTFASSSEYAVPIEIKSWNAGRTPLAHMVDVTNGFGLKVLAEHNFLNDNNIAFSPYGLMGVLVALYEGVDGESSFQIQRGMQLPWNRNVMRIGFRDIHRTLKTYFVPEEGFLAGLALNNENVTFNDSYKNILRFYGFDLDNDQLPTMAPQGNTTKETTTVASSANDTSGVTTTLSTISAASETSTVTTSGIDTREETTPSPNNETITTTSTIIQGASSAPNAESTPDTSLTTISAQDQSASETQTTTVPSVSTVVTMQTEPRTTSTTISTTTNAVMTTTNEPTPVTEATTIPISTIPDAETLSTQTFQATAALSDPANDAETIEQQTSQATVVLTNGVTLNEIDSESSTATISSTSLTVATEMSTFTTVTGENTASTVAMSNIPDATATDDSSTMINDNTGSTATISSTIPSTVTDLSSTVTGDNNSENTASTGFTSFTDSTGNTDVTVTGSTLIDTTTMIIESNVETLQRRKKSIVDFIFTNPPYFEDYVYYRSYDIPPILPNTNSNDKMFLANGLKNVQVTYMQYDTVLEYAYLPHLEASALRLPLDSDRYYLLILLPRRGGGKELGRLIARMARESDLSDIYNVLRPRRVRGLVPSFTVKGHVTLTTDLQKLGIRDVFEPRQRDFTPMTRQPAVYVRSIEQAVSVAIRKYRPDDHKKNRYVTNRDPVKFYATYPFLYFVMDSTIHVSLMAGKMVDPLNSRIL